MTKPDRATRAAIALRKLGVVKRGFDFQLAGVIRAEYQGAEELARLVLGMGAEDLLPILYDYKQMRDLARKFLTED